MTGGESDGRATSVPAEHSSAPLRRRTPARPILDLPHLWAMAVLAGVFVFVNLALIPPNDFWWHVRTGQWIVELGRVPGVDLYSYTQAGQPYAYSMWWLMQVALYCLYKAGGLPLVIFVNALVITASYLLLLRICRRAAGGNLRWAALSTLAAALLGMGNWVVRPQTISYLFFVLVLCLVERDASDPRDGARTFSVRTGLWLLPPLFAVWANAHAGFVAGLALLGAYLLARLAAWLLHRGSPPGGLILVVVLSALSLLINPGGEDTLRHLLAMFRNPVVRSLIAEWIPLTASMVDGALCLGVSALLAILLVASRYRPTTFEVTRLLLFGVMAAMSRRNVSWFGIVAAPTIGHCLGFWESGRQHIAAPRRARARLNLFAAALIALVALLSLPWLRPYLPLPQARLAYVTPDTPVGAADFLRTLPAPRRVFHSEAAGSYLIWAAPEVPVFIDPRFELYPEAQWRDWYALTMARYDWQAILDRYGVDTLLLGRDGQAALIEAASASGAWQQVYQDEAAVILVQSGGP